MKKALLFLFLYTIGFCQGMLNDIESGTQITHNVLESPVKSLCLGLSSCLGTTTTVFILELLAAKTLYQSSFESDDELSAPFYTIAACTSTLIGCLLGPQIFKMMLHSPQDEESDSESISS